VRSARLWTLALGLHIRCAALPARGIQMEAKVHGNEKEPKKREENRSQEIAKNELEVLARS